MTSSRNAVVQRLAGVIELARRPGTAGEEEAALMAVGRIVVRNSWLIANATANTALPRPTPKPSPDWRDALRRCAAQPERLSDWEREFVANLAHRQSLSSKQAGVLHRIAGRCGCNWSYP